MLHAAARSGKGSGMSVGSVLSPNASSISFPCHSGLFGTGEKECVLSSKLFPDIGAGLCRLLSSPSEGYTKGAVTQNVGEKGVNSVLDYVSSSNDWNLLKGFYEQTLDTLRRARLPSMNYSFLRYRRPVRPKLCGFVSTPACSLRVLCFPVAVGAASAVVFFHVFVCIASLSLSLSLVFLASCGVMENCGAGSTRTTGCGSSAT